MIDGGDTALPGNTGQKDAKDRPSPYFTVVIPTHNRAGMLGEAIKSVLVQTFVDLELIVVDDHCEDGTADTVASYEDPRISYVTNDHARGGAGARNAGIARARGEWVAFLDDDDTWLPRKLELQHKRILEAGNAVGLVYTGCAHHDSRANTLHPIVRRRLQGWVLRDLLHRNLIGGISSVAIRTDILRAIGGLDERFPALQDIDLYVRVAEVAQVVCVDQPLMHMGGGHEARITLDAESKLHGNCLFRDKYWDYIRRDPWLRHRAEGRIFAFAICAQDWRRACHSAPWTFAGLVLDLPNLLWVLRQVIVGKKSR